MELRHIVNWFNEEKLFKRFEGLRPVAERIVGDFSVDVAAEKLSLDDVQTIQEEATAIWVAMSAVIDLAEQTKNKLGVVVANQRERIAVMEDQQHKLVDYIDKINDAALLSSNATQFMLSSPDAAAKMLASFNPKVLKMAVEMLADSEDWQTIGMLHDLCKDKLDGKPLSKMGEGGRDGANAKG